jgi:hypothetical protein
MHGSIRMHMRGTGLMYSELAWGISGILWSTLGDIVGQGRSTLLVLYSSCAKLAGIVDFNPQNFLSKLF